MTPLKVQANAKINLHLDVGPLRKDGYHELRTLFQEISLHDRLTFRVSTGPIVLTSDMPSLPVGRENTVRRALESLKRKMKTNLGMSVHLEKKIPIGAGLGGGSSDAAASLKAAWTLWRKPKAKKIVVFERVSPAIHGLARRLGADVPFFLSGGRAWAEGTGEAIKKVSGGRPQWLVLVYPRIIVSTAEAYKLLDQHRKNRASGVGVLKKWGAGGSRDKTLVPFNSFEPVMFRKYPEIRIAKDTLVQMGCAHVMMSGSGSTVFGFVKDPAEGAAIFNQLKAKPWDVFLAQTVL